MNQMGPSTTSVLDVIKKRLGQVLVMPGQESEPVAEMDRCAQCHTGAQIVPTRDRRPVKANRGQISRQVLRTLKKTGHSKKKKKSRPFQVSFGTMRAKPSAVCRVRPGIPH